MRHEQATLYVPVGCAHGFQALTDPADVSYRIDRPHDPTEDLSIAFDDPELGIMRRRWRVIAVTLLTLIVLFCGVTVRMFVLPTTGMPARVNAIVVLGGPGNRLGLGLQLAQQGHAPYLLVSNGLPFILPAALCKPDHGSFTVICWNPDPGNTKGEAEFVGRIARQYHWTSVALVTTPDQAWRAALYVRRCYTGKVYSVTTPLNWTQWPYMIAYQWGATIKAETFQRGC